MNNLNIRMSQYRCHHALLPFLLSYRPLPLTHLKSLLHLHKQDHFLLDLNCRQRLLVVAASGRSAVPHETGRALHLAWDPADCVLVD